MKCLFLNGPLEVELRDVEKPVCGPKDAIVKLRSRGICGSDLNCFRVGAPASFGHEMAGVIVEAGPECTMEVGTRVWVSDFSTNIVSYSTEGTSDYGSLAYASAFSEYVLIKNATENVDLFPIPDSMSYSEAALVEPFCVSMSGVKKYPVTPETKAVVLGAGIIGMGAFEYLKSRGVKNIVVVDVCEARLEKAKECGAIPFNNKNGGLKEFLVETYGEGDPGMFSMIARPVPDVDLYIDCIGNNKLLDEILNMTKYEAQITILSLFHTKPEVNMANFLFWMIQKLCQHIPIRISSNRQTPTITLRTSSCRSKFFQFLFPMVIIWCTV